MISGTQQLEQVDFEGKDAAQIEELIRKRAASDEERYALIGGISNDTVRAEVAKP